MPDRTPVKPIITTINIGEILKQSAPIEALEAIEKVADALETAKAVMKAEALFADIQALVISTLAPIAALSAIIESTMDLILNTFDISFHELILEPKAGGLYDYATRFNFHLQNKQDPNRPYDEGSAAMCSIMLLVNYKDMAEAKKKFDGLVDMFKSAENSRIKILKEAIGAEDFDTLKEEFWGCWKKRYEAGTHDIAVTQGSWKKHSLSVLFPDVFDSLQTTMEGILNSAVPNINIALLSERIDKIFSTILDILNDILVIVNAWKSLLFDSGITVIIPPVCAASTTDGDQLNLVDAAKNVADNFTDGIEVTNATGAPPVSATATDNLYSAIYELATSIENKSYTELFGLKADYSTLLDVTQFMGGINVVFKGPSTQQLMAQVTTFCALIGIPLPDDFSEKIYPF